MRGYIQTIINNPETCIREDEKEKVYVVYFLLDKSWNSISNITNSSALLRFKISDII